MVLKSKFNAVKVTSNSQKTITQNTIATLEHIITKTYFLYDSHKKHGRN